MTFKWDRLDIVDPCRLVETEPADDGEYVLAEDAINREAVNADKIRTLEVRLKESNLRANRLDRLLAEKNRALVEIRDITQRTFDIKE